LVILISIALLWALAACSISQLAPERAALVTVAPTRTLKPTYTATTTGTPTYTPSPTPTPSHTPTNTPIPTNTPVPTDTPSPTLTPTATDTPTITPTPTDTTRPTPRPTRRPTNTPVPRPTNTPPPPFSGQVARGFARCDGYQGVEGFVKHSGGAGYPDVAVGVWSNTWTGIVTTSEQDGKFAVNLSNLPPGEFRVAVVRYESCTTQGELRTASGCQLLSNVVTFSITENCTGAGASQVAIVEFRGP
jgi:hypothetical protein